MQTIKVDDLFIRKSYVSVFSQCPWPWVSVDGVGENAVGDPDSRESVDGSLRWEGGKSREESPGDFGTSGGNGLSSKASEE